MQTSVPNQNVLPDGGAMGSLIRTFHWEGHPLGSMTHWPAALRSSLAIMLQSRFPMFVLWGRELYSFYNDAALELLGDKGKHPDSLGAPAENEWKEVWDDMGHLLDKALQGEPTFLEDLKLRIGQNGSHQETYWTVSYSPIFSDDGIGGVLVVCTETTGKVVTLKEKEEKENLLEFAIDATELGIWEYNVRTRRISANDRLKAWFGISSEDFCIEEALLNVAPADRARIREAINLSISPDNGGTFDVIFSIGMSGNIQERLVHAKGRAWFEGSTPIRLNGTLQDITQIVAFNQKLDDSERRFRNIIEQSPIAKCFLRGEDLIIDIANPKMLQFWGIPDSAIGKPLGESVKEISSKSLRKIKGIFRDKKPFNINETTVVVGGETRYYNISFKAILDSDGEIFGIMQTAIDVTQQVVARQNAQRSEARFRDLIAQAPIAIGLFSGRNHIVEMSNLHMTEFIGKGDNIIGRPLPEVMPELHSDMQPFLKIMDEVFASGNPFSISGKHIRITRNGITTDNYYDIIYSPVFDGAGQVYGILEIVSDVSEKVVAQKQILESESRFRNLVESAPIPIGVYTGPEMRIMLANQAITKIFGKGHDVIGKLYAEVNPELGSQEIFKQLEYVYQTGSPFHAFNSKIEFTDNGKNRTYYFNYSFTPLRDASGNIYGVLNTASDVTAINTIRFSLEEREMNLRRTIRQAPVAMCLLRGENFVVEIANPMMYDLWGRPESIMAERPLFDSLYELRDQGFVELLREVYSTGETYRAFGVPVTILRQTELKQIYVDFVYEAIRETDGSISGVMVVAIDMTENVIARKRIEEAEQKARLAIASAKMGTYEVNLKTDEITTSDRFKEIWGVGREITRQEFAAFIHPEDREARLAAHKRAAQTGNLHYECRIIRKNGSIIHISINGKILFDDNQQPETLLGVIQDVTEQKLFAEELSKQVKDRTQELYRSNEDLMRFAHVASHDLKEPVRKIKVFSNMIEEQFRDKIPPKAQTYLSKVQSATDRMFSMIEGVLAYSTLSASEQAIEKIDLEEVFGSIEVDLEVLIQQKNATIKTSSLPAIEGAQVLIYQLFYNLINNALKFSRESDPALIIVEGSVEATNDGNFATVVISDNGIGIAPEYASKIFDAFARLNPKDRYEGTGLGLALCKKIVERHHGSITATGQEGKGAVFTVKLPMLQKGRLL